MQRIPGPLLLLGWAALVPGSLSGQLPEKLAPEKIGEVRQALDAFKRDPRGPYQRLRWFCADGSVLPPAGTPCRERGGGVQHAELSERAVGLARLGFNVGTLMQAVDFAALKDTSAGGYRLAEFVLQDHLAAVDDGWVLRRARYYRGARQAEDEDRRGGEFLTWLLADTAWVRANYLLAVSAVAAIPHERAGEGSLAVTARNLATEVAAADTAFTAIRIKIHGYPAAEDQAAVRRYLASGNRPEIARLKAEELLQVLGRQYDPARRRGLLGQYRRLVSPLLQDELARLIRLTDVESDSTMAEAAHLAAAIRRTVVAPEAAKVRLALMDLQQVIQDIAFATAVGPETGAARQRRLEGVSHRLLLAHGAGLLSRRELAAATGQLDALMTGPELSASQYRDGIDYLARSLDWGVGSVRGMIGAVLAHYQPVEPLASGYLDAAVRGSSLFLIAAELSALRADADQLVGTAHEVFGDTSLVGVRGLNPGVALRRLSILRDHRAEVDRDAIYLLPHTPADMHPVSGVLTMDEGNLLSHVQLLSRNLGIPNATVSPTMLARFESLEGREIFYAVSPGGRVIVKLAEHMTDAERELVSRKQITRSKVTLDQSRLDLSITEPIPLAELRAEHSGVVVGPKAANLGQLAAYFPDHVSAGVALPFGLFLSQVSQPGPGSSQTVPQMLGAAYRHAAEMRRGGAAEAKVDEFMIGELAKVRQAILDGPWHPAVRRSILDAVAATFGDRVAEGVFVRSDTNVEDLPQFSGAGLNLTVPHRITPEQILDAVKRVWTSPFTERAYRWRKEILDEQSAIYPSVLLLATVPSDKSGVMISSGLGQSNRNALTIVTAEGVGGAVDGEDAETIVIDSLGAVTLLSQTKAYRRRIIDPVAQGVTWLPARRPEVLLQPAEIQQLRWVIDSWNSRFPGAADQEWDVEFGFVAGRLWLFQIRPFVRFRNAELLERLRSLDVVSPRADRPVDLSQEAR